MKILFADSATHIELAFSFGALAPFENYEQMKQAGWKEATGGGSFPFSIDTEVIILTVEFEPPSKWLAAVESEYTHNGVPIKYVDVKPSEGQGDQVNRLLTGKPVTVTGAGKTPRGSLTTALRLALSAANVDAEENVARALNEAIQHPDVINAVANGRFGGLTYRGMPLEASIAEHAGQGSATIRLRARGATIERVFSGSELVSVVGRASVHRSVLKSSPLRGQKIDAVWTDEATLIKDEHARIMRDKMRDIEAIKSALEKHGDKGMLEKLASAAMPSILKPPK